LSSPNSIDLLIGIYNDWGDRQKLSPLGSAYEELMGNPKLNHNQKNWLRKFIDVWDKAQELEREIFLISERVNNG
jgi:hypothetical protein